MTISIDNNGNNGVLRDRDDVTRIGPRLQLEILPSGALDPLSFTVTWTALSEVAGSLGNSRLFDAQGKLDLSGNEQFTLTLTYQNGDSPLLERDTETLKLGIGVKF